MPTSTVRVSGHTCDQLRELAARSGESMASILDKAIEAHWRRQFLAEVNASFAALRANPGAWREELAERAEWDAMLADGIGDN